MYVKHVKKSEWLDCQGNEFFPKQKGTPSLVKIEHKNTATLDSARSKKKSKVAVLQLLSHLQITVSFTCDSVNRRKRPKVRSNHKMIAEGLAK